MKKYSYIGKIVDGLPVVVFYSADQVHDLIEMAVRDGIIYPGPVAWGRSGQAAEHLARCILWHASGDFQVADILNALFAYDVVQKMKPSWGLEREWVRDWIQHHRKFIQPDGWVPYQFLVPSRN